MQFVISVWQVIKKRLEYWYYISFFTCSDQKLARKIGFCYRTFLHNHSIKGISHMNKLHRFKINFFRLLIFFIIYFNVIKFSYNTKNLLFFFLSLWICFVHFYSKILIFLSCCKFWIYWVRVNFTILHPTCKFKIFDMTVL